jgi:hypothetical protein
MAQGILSRNPCANFHNRVFVTISDVRPAPWLLWSHRLQRRIDLPQRAVFQQPAENSELA